MRRKLKKSEALIGMDLTSIAVIGFHWIDLLLTIDTQSQCSSQVPYHNTALRFHTSSQVPYQLSGSIPALTII